MSEDENTRLKTKYGGAQLKYDMTLQKSVTRTKPHVES